MDDLHTRLSNVFIRRVRERLSGEVPDGMTYDPKNLAYDLVHVEDMPRVNGVMYHLRIKIGNNTTLEEIMIIAGRLDVYTRMNDQRGHPDAGYNWFIGDGDDGQAVFFNEGYICIWVRGWKD